MIRLLIMQGWMNIIDPHSSEQQTADDSTVSLEIKGSVEARSRF